MAPLLSRGSGAAPAHRRGGDPGCPVQEGNGAATPRGRGTRWWHGRRWECTQMLDSAGTPLTPSLKQASHPRPPSSSKSAIGCRMLQDPPARQNPRRRCAVRGGFETQPWETHSNSLKLLLAPLPPVSWLLSTWRRTCACPGSGRGFGPCLERTNPDSAHVRICVRPRTLLEIHVVAYAVVQTACK